MAWGWDAGTTAITFAASTTSGITGVATQCPGSLISAVAVCETLNIVVACTLTGGNGFSVQGFTSGGTTGTYTIRWIAVGS